MAYKHGVYVAEQGTRDGNCWPAGRYRHCADQPRK